MKRIALAALAVALAGAVFAEPASKDAPKKAIAQPPPNEALWPAFFAFAQWPETPDLIGLRLTIPYSSKQECVTGIDLGFWGCCRDFEGLAVNVLRNDVEDTCSGIVVGFYNSMGSGYMLGSQVGLINEAGSFRGAQVGLINSTGDGRGLQVGLINRAETLYGFQVGLINVIRDAEVPFCVLGNIGF